MSLKSLNDTVIDTIKCNELKASNIYSEKRNVEVIDNNNVFTVYTIDPDALFTRNGEYITCNGFVEIIMNSGILDSATLFVEIKILEYDNPYNSISSDVQLVGGGGFSSAESSFISVIEYESLNSVMIRFKSNSPTGGFAENTQWKLSYSFIYKQRVF